MNDEHSFSRRASLKALGAAGAALALGGAAGAQTPDSPTVPSGPLDKQTVVDVAVGRMAKGHS